MVVAAQGNGGKNVFLVARNYDSDGDLPVIGPVGGVESATARVKADLSTKVAAERSFERGSVKLCGTGRKRCGVLRWHGVRNIFEDAGAGRKKIASFVAESLCLSGMLYNCFAFEDKKRCHSA